MSNNNEWTGYWDVLSFFMIDRDVEFNGEWFKLRTDLADTPEKFKVLFDRELARLGDKNNNKYKSILINDLTKIMDKFKVILDDEFADKNRPNPEKLNLLKIIEEFSEYISTLVTAQYVFSLTETQVSRLLECVALSDTLLAKSVFAGSVVNGKVRIVNPALIFTIGRLVSVRRINATLQQALEFISTNFKKNNCEDYSPNTIRRYLEDADTNKCGTLISLLNGSPTSN